MLVGDAETQRLTLEREIELLWAQMRHLGGRKRSRDSASPCTRPLWMSPDAAFWSSSDVPTLPDGALQLVSSNRFLCNGAPACSSELSDPTTSESAWEYIEGPALVPHPRGRDGRWCSGRVGQRRPFRLQTPVRPNPRQSTGYLRGSASTPLVAPLPWGTCLSRRPLRQTAAR
jgi:hypothetical protein